MCRATTFSWTYTHWRVLITTQDRIKVVFALLFVIEDVADTRHAVFYNWTAGRSLLCCAMPQSVPRASITCTDSYSNTDSDFHRLQRCAGQLTNFVTICGYFLLCFTLLFRLSALLYPNTHISLTDFNSWNGNLNSLILTDLPYRNWETRSTGTKYSMLMCVCQKQAHNNSIA